MTEQNKFRQEAFKILKTIIGKNSYITTTQIKGPFVENFEIETKDDNFIFISL